MSIYHVTTTLGKQEWQINNQARDHHFVSDDLNGDKGPNPVEYLMGAVNSCITMSAGMVAKAHNLDVKNFKLTNEAWTEALDHGKSHVSRMKIRISFVSSMKAEEKEKFLDHVLRVSTVYQTVQDSVMMDIKLI